MSDKSVQDKTESATPHRREKSREKGQVARSTDLNSVAVLFTGMISLKILLPTLIGGLTTFATLIYQNSSRIELSRSMVSSHINDSLGFLIPLISPLFILVLLAGLGINFLQVGFKLSTKAMKPKFSKINPMKGIKRLFSIRSIVEFFKGIFKISIVSFVGFTILKKYIGQYSLLANSSLSQIGVFTTSLLFELSIKICAILIILALADYAYQKYDHEKSMKMTKQEVKDEFKNQDGNPEIKGRIRNLQKQIARNRMMAAIPEATVVVTNPTHIAIALQYQPAEKTDAPIVVAKGQRKIAEKIKEIASKNNIPIIENKPLARSLFETTEIGMEIPIIYYQVVAEVLAQVYQINKENNSIPNQPSYA